MVMMKKPLKREFWVTNIAPDRDVGLSDLRVTIRHGQSCNLLDSRHYSYTLEQLQASAETGSIKAKSRFIKVREIQPQPVIKPGLYVAKSGRIVEPLRTNVEINIPYYEELDVEAEKESLEKLAEEEAEMAQEDQRPVLGVDKIYDE